jgi:hypothetical protein
MSHRLEKHVQLDKILVKSITGRGVLPPVCCMRAASASHWNAFGTFFGASPIACFGHPTGILVLKGLGPTSSVHSDVVDVLVLVLSAAHIKLDDVSGDERREDGGDNDEHELER